MWKIYSLKEKAGTLNKMNQQDQRSDPSRITGGDSPGVNDHLLASTDHTRVSTLISTLMLNLALHLSTTHIRHIENCCVFMWWVGTRLAKGFFACSRQKCVPGEKSLCVKSYRTGKEGLQTRYFGFFHVLTLAKLQALMKAAQSPPHHSWTERKI